MTWEIAAVFIPPMGGQTTKEMLIPKTLLPSQQPTPQPRQEDILSLSARLRTVNSMYHR